ncbi:rod-binding protein [Neogemmobacter tilapiae]|uniref:Chemotaxis protein CheL n=1 Tax=Neogemmobacter tilapiae TaxID=875041 RepID=A0A918TKG2_9RHOB|nr:rod-binding protein [Gemmobacter tilapiae]GHC51884.1 chemotaxis protein CheL [Gemmobacter tilapiae]
MIEPIVAGPRPQAADPLWAKAQALESAFLSEMLGHAGVGQTRESFGGGAGEAQFSSFLREKQAEALVRAGGIGLSQSIFEALKRHEAQK